MEAAAHRDPSLLLAFSFATREIERDFLACRLSATTASWSLTVDLFRQKLLHNGVQFRTIMLPNRKIAPLFGKEIEIFRPLLNARTAWREMERKWLGVPPRRLFPKESSRILRINRELSLLGQMFVLGNINFDGAQAKAARLEHELSRALNDLMNAYIRLYSNSCGQGCDRAFLSSLPRLIQLCRHLSQVRLLVSGASIGTWGKTRFHADAIEDAAERAGERLRIWGLIPADSINPFKCPIAYILGRTPEWAVLAADYADVFDYYVPWEMRKSHAEASKLIAFITKKIKWNETTRGIINPEHFKDLMLANENARRSVAETALLIHDKYRDQKSPELDCSQTSRVKEALEQLNSALGRIPSKETILNELKDAIALNAIADL